MRNCLLLTSILLKNNSSLNYGNSKKSGNKRQIALMILIGICMLPLIAMLFEGFAFLYKLLAPFHMEELLYELLFTALSLTLLVFSLPFVLSVMFFSRDLEYLQPMPLSSWQIVGAKFLTIMCYEYISTLFIGLPLIAGIASEAHVGASFWLIAILILLAVPVLPVIYAAFLGTLVLYLTRNWKHKEALMTFFSLLLILFSTGLGMLVSRFGQAPDAAAILALMTNSQPIVSRFSLIFPNLTLAKNALLHTDALMLILYLLSTIVLIGLFLSFGNHVYLKAVTGMTETSCKKERLSDNKIKKALHTSGTAAAFASREWKLLIRTPIYFLNCVVTAFIVPLILFITLFFSIPQVKNIIPALQQFLPLLRQADESILNGLLLLIIFAVSGFMCSMNLAPATCISREGQNIGDLKFIPVSTQDILKGKMICSLAISAAAVYPYAIALPIISALLLHTPLWLLIPSLLIASFTLIMLGHLMLLGDLLYPKLNWTSEQAAVKQNMTALVTDLLCMALCFALGFAFVMLYRMHTPIQILIIGGILLLALLAVTLWQITCRYAEKAFQKIEI